MSVVSAIIFEPIVCLNCSAVNGAERDELLTCSMGSVVAKSVK